MFDKRHDQKWLVVFLVCSYACISHRFLILNQFAFPVIFFESTDEKSRKRCEEHLQECNSDEDRAILETIMPVFLDGFVIIVSVNMPFHHTVVRVHDQVRFGNTEKLIVVEVFHCKRQTSSHDKAQDKRHERHRKDDGLSITITLA